MPPHPPGQWHGPWTQGLATRRPRSSRLQQPLQGRLQRGAPACREGPVLLMNRWCKPPRTDPHAQPAPRTVHRRPCPSLGRLRRRGLRVAATRFLGCPWRAVHPVPPPRSPRTVRGRLLRRERAAKPKQPAPPGRPGTDCAGVEQTASPRLSHDSWPPSCHCFPPEAARGHRARVIPGSVART